MRRLPSLQRKLLYVVVAFALCCLVYLLLSGHVYQQDDVSNAAALSMRRISGGGGGAGVGGLLLNALQSVVSAWFRCCSVPNLVILGSVTQFRFLTVVYTNFRELGPCLTR